MPTYDCLCPSCGTKQEYHASIKTFKEDTPNCEKCGTKTVYSFAANGGGFLLNGSDWPGQRIKRQKEHQRAVNTPVREYVESGGRSLNKK